MGDSRLKMGADFSDDSCPYVRSVDALRQVPDDLLRHLIRLHLPQPRLVVALPVPTASQDNVEPGLFGHRPNSFRVLEEIEFGVKREVLVDTFKSAGCEIDERFAAGVGVPAYFDLGHFHVTKEVIDVETVAHEVEVDVLVRQCEPQLVT